MNSDALRRHIAGTYFSLRSGIVALSFLLPIVVYVAAGFAVKGSLSEYYYSGGFIRDWLVGTLVAVGAFLVLYKGFSTIENVALNSAGVLLAIVALEPCECHRGGTFSLHGFAAVSFFLTMAFVCIRCAPETLELVSDPAVKARFKRRYKVIAGLMVLSPVAAFVISARDSFQTLQFYVEVLGIYSFATYWLVKSLELRRTNAEELALQGKVAHVRGRGVVHAEPGVEVMGA
jgi:hypothetical protein